MTHPPVTEVIVVGAGVAGLSAARALHHAGTEVKLLEKSRGLGGRAATRRVHGVRVDHGAQYFTARDPRWQRQVDAWLGDGVLQVWTHGFYTLSSHGLEAPAAGGHPRYTFAEGMNTLGKLLGEDLTVERDAKVTALARGAAYWTLTLEDGSVRRARRVLLNLPAPQALELGAAALGPATLATLRAVTFAPCLALLAGFRRAAPAWRGVQVRDEHSPLAWLACDSSKPGRAGAAEGGAGSVLVLHATPEFSAQHLAALDEATAPLLGVAAALGFENPLWTQLQRWRYAKVIQPLAARFLREDTLFFCGDWCGGSKLEDAYLSGLEVADALLRA
jgi:renalase